MTLYKKLLILLAAAPLFLACSSDNDEEASSENANRNTPTTEQAVTRLEFPRLKGGSSKVIVYRTPENTTYDKDGVNFAVEWDTDKKSQRWTCYTITKANRTKNVNRYSGTPQYPFDTDNLSQSDYHYTTSAQYGTSDLIYGSGFDHGHICPSNDRRYSFLANKQTFYMTNMQPQYAVFNGSAKEHSYSGLWLNMESFLQGSKASNGQKGLTLNDGDTLFVCKGGTIDTEDGILMRIQGKQIVPKYFFTALLYKKASGYTTAMAFWFEHTNVYHGNDPLKNYAITVRELEQKTGIDFFCNLPDATENKVETTLYLSDFGL